MNNNSLVSIITPCFNGEKYLKPYLDSVINQTYDRIELIFVNDGSTDHTLDIANSYKPIFDKRGFSFVIISQENKGQAAAINQGLKIFNGDYLMWVDSDDILLSENVSRKVEFLKSHPEYGFVLCEAEIVSSDNIDMKLSDYRRKKPEGNDTLFTDLLTGDNVVFNPGVIMVRKEAFEKSIPTKQIFESREGQNWQLMLPISYYYRCGYIEECLFKVVSHSESHSRMNRTTGQQLSRIDGFSVLLNEVISNMSISDAEKNKYLDIISLSIARQRLKTIFAAGFKAKIKYSNVFFGALIYLFLNNGIGKEDIKRIYRFLSAKRKIQ